MARILPERELMELVREVAEEALDMDLSEASPQTPLRSLGMDSSDQLELVSILEDRLDVCLPDSAFSELETVGGLIAAFARLQAADSAPRADEDSEERPSDARR
ncbi:MAG TPA: acyl carrier protein [Trebonia sp.]|nr:acyl carrier protein [Trebonia sp.]